MKKKSEEEIIKAFKDYINNPFADGYTVVALENKYKLSIDEMRDLYNKSKEEKYKKIATKEQAYDEIDKVLTVYYSNRQFGNCVSFPSKDIEDIMTSCNHNLESHEN